MNEICECGFVFFLEKKIGYGLLLFILWWFIQASLWINCTHFIVKVPCSQCKVLTSTLKRQLLESLLFPLTGHLVGPGHFLLGFKAEISVAKGTSELITEMQLEKTECTTQLNTSELGSSFEILVFGLKGIYIFYIKQLFQTMQIQIFLTDFFKVLFKVMDDHYASTTFEKWINVLTMQSQMLAKYDWWCFKIQSFLFYSDI